MNPTATNATAEHPPAARAAEPPRLLEQVGAAARRRGESEPNARQIVAWVRAYVVFHGKRHPRELALPAVRQFLQHVVRTNNNPLVALEAARGALELLYEHVLGIDLGELPRPQPPRLLDQMSQVLRVRHYSPRTEDCYLFWVRRFILFHGKRHPREMGAAEVAQFLTHLAVDGHVSASTQNQALNALVFLYRQVLEIDLGKLDAVRARRGTRLPVVLAPAEVAAVLARVEGGDGVFALMARLLYGSGLRLMECCQLRVKDVQLLRGQIMVRSGKGNKDRVVMLPASAREPLERQVEARHELHERRPGAGRGARGAARRAGAEIPAGRTGAWLAIRVRIAAAVALPADGTARTPPCLSGVGAASGRGRGSRGGAGQGDSLPHVSPFVRDAPR